MKEKRLGPPQGTCPGLRPQRACRFFIGDGLSAAVTELSVGLSVPSPISLTEKRRLLTD